MKKPLIYSLFMSFLIFACQSEEQEESPSLVNLPLNERIERIFAENKKEKINFEIKYEKEIQHLYTLNKYQSYWFVNDTLTFHGKQLILFFDSTEFYGLPKQLYPIHQVKSDKDLLQIELALSESLFRISKHFRYGILDSASINLSWDLHQLSDSIPSFIHRFHKDLLLIENLKKLQPDHFQFRWLSEAWKIYLGKNNLDSTKFFVPNIKKDSLKAYQVAREILFHKGYIDSFGIRFDSLFLKALEQYQEEHNLKGDHVIGTNTIIALEKTNWSKFQQIVLALDKLKWSYSLPEKYFRVNIAEQKLRLIDSNRVIREHRIIVGHYDTQTPELKSKMNRIVLYPYWNVPHSISSKEIVYSARRDTGYIRKHRYKVFRGKTEVDPSTIEWKKYNKDRFPFRLRQEPGPKNSLGLIKFLFPNKYSVYLHDTPTKWLFRTKMRYYSHGCMRLEDPRDLAYYLITTDPKNKFIADSLDVELEKAENQSIRLRKSIPIFVEYITVSADSTGKIFFFNDHYLRDEKYIEAIFGKN